MLCNFLYTPAVPNLIMISLRNRASTNKTTRYAYTWLGKLDSEPSSDREQMFGAHDAKSARKINGARWESGWVASGTCLLKYSQMHAHSSHQPHKPTRHPPICHRLHLLIRVFIHRADPQWHPRAYALSHSVTLSPSLCLPDSHVHTCTHQTPVEITQRRE